MSSLLAETSLTVVRLELEPQWPLLADIVEKLPNDYLGYEIEQYGCIFRWNAALFGMLEARFKPLCYAQRWRPDFSTISARCGIGAIWLDTTAGGRRRIISRPLGFAKWG
jgi:hypothetical protein